MDMLLGAKEQKKNTDDAKSIDVIEGLGYG